MNIFDALRGRRAVRAYGSEPVNMNLLLAMVDAAAQAPNSMNRQAWLFSAVKDRAVLAEISVAAKRAAIGALVDAPETEAVRARLQDPDFDIFYGAPTLMIISATALDDMAVYDCCLAAQNFMLAAHANGLGTCWIGLAEAWLRTAEAKARLGLAPDVRPVAPIVVGRPKGPTAAPGRKRARIQWLPAASPG